MRAGRAGCLGLACCASWGGAFAADVSRARLTTDDTIVEVEAAGDHLVLTGLRSTRTDWNWTDASEQSFINTVEMNGQTVPLKWKFKRRTGSVGRLVEEVFVFENEDPPLELTSVWMAHAGPGPVEHQIRITNQGRAPLLLPLQASLVFDARPARGNALENFWVEKGSGTPSAKGTHRTRVENGFSVSLISLPYCEEPRDAIPWTAVQDVSSRQGWYAGVEFSGRVQITLRAISGGAKGDGVHAELGLNAREPYRTRLMPGETFEAPTVFVGCYQGDVEDGANRLRRWTEAHLRPPVHDARFPLLVNNSWGSGMAVDERLAKQMIDDSAELGLELFHIDAGWFRGVGDWRADEKKFPRGLGPLAESAHAKGLKFGLWVGWTQGGHQEGGGDGVLSVFNQPMNGWFARDYSPGWRTQEFTGADVCLGGGEAREWCLGTLRRVVKENKLDLLEHDQRMIVDSCGRQDHLHTSSRADIAYHAARGYYQVYDMLRAENPDLLFEDCVNGGRMVDYGVVRRTHYISITDTYDPLSNRRAFYDASYALPPSMCECYVANHPGKSIANFRYMLRSGMMGWCTIMLDMSQWTADQRAAAKRQFELYKTELRPLIARGDLYHVSERPDGVRWDGMQYVSPESGKAVVFAFRGTTKEAQHQFVLRGLDAQKKYELSYEDGTGKNVTLSGAGLMQEGVTVDLAEPQSSELIFLRRR